LVALSVDNRAQVMIAQRLISIRSKKRKSHGDGREAGLEASLLALAELLMPIGRSALTAPSDAKFTCLDRDHEEKISHRVGQPQVGECGLTMFLPIGYGVAKEAQGCFNLGQAAMGAARPTGFALAEAAAVVARNFVAVHGVRPVTHVTPLHSLM
jgi:hypothetical protein